KTPLTSLALHVTGLLRAVRADRPDESPTHRVVDRLGKIDLQVRRLATLVDELLDVARLSRGRLSLELAQGGLAPRAREVVERFADQAEVAGVALAVESAGPVLGQWDPGRLDQVIDNLVSNAIKYGGRRPVVVRVAASDGGAILAVHDEGIGIA